MFSRKKTLGLALQSKPIFSSFETDFAGPEETG
jgi:hypothetical protein